MSYRDVEFAVGGILIGAMASLAIANTIEPIEYQHVEPLPAMYEVDWADHYEACLTSMCHPFPQRRHRTAKVQSLTETAPSPALHPWSSETHHGE